MLVADVDKSVMEMQGIAERLGGFVSDLTVSGTKQGSRYGTLTVKVSAASFDTAMTEIEGKSILAQNKHVATTNVTEEYIDLSARIVNKKAREDVLNGLMSRAAKVSDLMEIEREIESVRSEIESLEGRKQYLDAQASYSTISVSLSEDQQAVVVDDSLRPWDTLSRAVSAMLSIAGRILLGLAVVAVSILPILVVFIAIMYGLFRLGIAVVRRMFL